MPSGIVPDLGAGRSEVNCRIRRVVELNWRIYPFGVFSRISLLLAIAPFIPLGARGKHNFGSVHASSVTRRSKAHGLRHGEDVELVTPRLAATNARAMPVLPLVGSISTVFPGAILPSFSAVRRSWHYPQCGLSRSTRGSAFQLYDNGVAWAIRRPLSVQPHKGSAADFTPVTFAANARHDDLLFEGPNAWTCDWIESSGNGRVVIRGGICASDHRRADASTLAPERC